MNTTLLRRMLAGCLVAGCAAAAPLPLQSNLTKDPGFEGEIEKETGIPKDWLPFSSNAHNFRMIKGTAHGGAQCMRMTAQKTPQAHLGLYQSIPAESKKKYTLTAWLQNDPQDKLGGSARVVLSLEFVDANGQEVARFSSKPEGQGLAKARWSQVKVVGKAPPYSAFVKVVVSVQDGDGRGEGSVLVDDVALVMN